MKNHMRFLILIVCFLLLATGCSSGYENAASQQPEEVSGQEVSTGMDGNQQQSETYSVNEPFLFGSMEFTVLGSEEKQEYNGSNTQGKFIIVTIDVKNQGKEPEGVDSSYFVLVDINKNIYEPDGTRDITYDGNEYFAMDTINPGLSHKGRVSFEVPKEVNKYYLGIRDNMFDFGGADYRYVLLKNE